MARAGGIATDRPLTLEEINEQCSRLHTTRRRQKWPWSDDDEMREDSRMLAVIVEGKPAVIVPTRMHEPGWYIRSRIGDEHWGIRDDNELLMLAAGGRITFDPDAKEPL